MSRYLLRRRRAVVRYAFVFTVLGIPPVVTVVALLHGAWFVVAVAAAASVFTVALAVGVIRAMRARGDQ